MYAKGHWRKETYRYAAVFFDDFGNQFGAQWLDDVTMPSQSDTGFNLTNVDSQYQISLNVLSVIVSGIDITAFKDRVSGISIMRCERDKTIIAQGLLLDIIHKNGDAANVYVPVGFPRGYYSDFNQNKGESLGPNIISVMSPELDFNYSELTSTPATSGDYIESVAGLSVLNAIPNNDGVSAEHIWDKFAFTHPLPINQFKAEVQQNFSFAPNAEGAFSSIYFKNYDIPAVQDTSSELDKRVGTGGFRTLIEYKLDYVNPSGYTNVLINYVRPKGISGLYGGQSDAAKANNQYLYTGHYLPINANLLADIYDSSTGKYILNGMQVFGGDCFINLYDRAHVELARHYVKPGENPGGDTPDIDASVYNWNGIGGADKGRGTWSYALIFPCESNINVSLRAGDHISRDTSALASPGIYNPYRDEQFIYNGVYSSEKTQVTYTALPLNFKNVNRFPFMVRWSELKNLGENIDNMRVFLINNFKNVDALHGELVAGLIGNDRFFYLQERGVGYMPIEEREMTGGVVGQALQLGVGTVGQRADNLDKFYGTQHTFSVYTGDDHFAFFDFRRKALLIMSFDGQAADLTIVKGLSQFFNNIFIPVENSSNNIYNREDTINGYGIISTYDARHKLGLMTFKFKNIKPNNVDVLDFTIGFSMNPKIKAFVSFFSFIPALYIEHNNKLYSTGFNDNLLKIQGSTNYIIGQLILGSNNGTIPTSTNINNYYVCISNFTTPPSPVIPESDPTHWALAGSQSSVWQHWKGDICKFFGITYPYEIEIISNGAVTRDANNTIDEKVFDNCEVYGNDTAFTDVIYTDSKRIASDNNIQSNNKNFRYIDNSWWFNVALSKGKERMLDHYIKVKLVVKNYISNPTISLNTVKRIVYLRTRYRKKL